MARYTPTKDGQTIGDNMERYLELLKTAGKLFEELAKSTVQMKIEMSTARNDHQAIVLALTEKRAKLDVLELELKNRAVAFEAGLDKIRQEVDEKAQKAAAMEIRASVLVENAKRDRELAASVLEDANYKARNQHVVKEVREKVGAR